MAQTQIRGNQVLDSSIQRNDLDVATPGNAVIRKIIAGTNITLTSTGVDAGAGDVTINAASGGGGAVTQTTITVPPNTSEYYEAVVVDATVTPTTKIVAALVGELDAENDIESLKDDKMRVYAVAETGQVRFVLVGEGAFLGDFKVNYQEF